MMEEMWRQPQTQSDGATQAMAIQAFPVVTSPLFSPALAWSVKEYGFSDVALPGVCSAPVFGVKDLFPSQISRNM